MSGYLEPGRMSRGGPDLSPGQLAQLACIMEVTARKPGNVSRRNDLEDLHLLDFLFSAAAIARPLDRAASEGIGVSVLAAVEATRSVVATNTNLGMILLLAPLAAVPRELPLRSGIEMVLARTTVDDARAVYRAIRLARPGGLGRSEAQDVNDDPTMDLRSAMALGAARDLIARQYACGYPEVLGDGLGSFGASLEAGEPIETAIVSTFLHLLARHPDSLIVRKWGKAVAEEVSRRASGILRAGWPEDALARSRLDELDDYLRMGEEHPLNPGTTADLVSAVIFCALREGEIPLPRPAGPQGWSARSS